MNKIDVLHTGDIIRSYNVPSDGTPVQRYIILHTDVKDVETGNYKIVYQELFEPYTILSTLLTCLTEDIEVEGSIVPKFYLEDEAIQITLSNVITVNDLFFAVAKCKDSIVVKLDNDAVCVTEDLKKKYIAAKIFCSGNIVNKLDVICCNPEDVVNFIDLI